MPVWPSDPEVELRTVATFEKEGYYLNLLCIGEHTGTHINAPSYFISGGRDIANFPIWELVVPAVVIDVREKCKNNPDFTLGIEDLLAWEAEHGWIPYNFDAFPRLSRGGGARISHELRNSFCGEFCFGATDKLGQIASPGSHNFHRCSCHKDRERLPCPSYCACSQKSVHSLELLGETGPREQRVSVEMPRMDTKFPRSRVATLLAPDRSGLVALHPRMSDPAPRPGLGGC